MPMSESRIVFSYGCPRTGTTFMQKMIAQGKGYIPAYIREYDTMHPCNGSWGLFLLARCLKNSLPLFVRTIRNPIDIFESFYTVNHLGLMTEKIEDETIYSMILEESKNSALLSEGMVSKDSESIVWKDIQGYPAQHDGISSASNSRPEIITVKYEELGDAEARLVFLTKLISRLEMGQENLDIFLKYIEDTFMKISVRIGRLKTGVTGLVPPEKREEIKDRLRDVFIVEGYNV